MIIGIDPGFDGGVTLLSRYGEIEYCAAMPLGIITMTELKTVAKETKQGIILDKVPKTRSEVDLETIKEELGERLWDEVTVYIEGVGARPNEGVVSSFNFGYNYGLLMGMFKAYEVPVVKVYPVKWKHAIFPKGTDKSSKDVSISIARKLVPDFDFRRTDKCTTYHDGMAESYLIAEYGRRIVYDTRNRNKS